MRARARAACTHRSRRWHRSCACSSSTRPSPICVMSWSTGRNGPRCRCADSSPSWAERRERMQPKIRRRHDMPFGAQFTAAGEVRFRLWAPAARQVDVILYHTGGRQLLAMHSLPGGWFALETAAARAGSLYRFRLDGVREVADPASRCNPQGVHGPSEVIEPCAFAWDDEGWRAPACPPGVLSELDGGPFPPGGPFPAGGARLEHLTHLG